MARKLPVLIMGPSGVGKSHKWPAAGPLAQALGWEACNPPSKGGIRGYDVLYTPCAKLLASLAAGRAESGPFRGHGSFERRMQAIVRPDLLILDDFGLKPLLHPAPEDMYDMAPQRATFINERYEKGATIITRNTPLRGCNRAINEFPQIFGDPLLASAGLDRLLHNASVLVKVAVREAINGQSFRARNRNLISATKPAQEETTATA